MKTIYLLFTGILILISTSIFAQLKPNHVIPIHDSVLVKKGEYYCIMHPEVQSKKAAKCTKCGRALNLSTKEQMKYSSMNLYVCPMHPKETSNKPGKCTKCGTNLVVKKKGTF
jgi:hypothetical protein